jgi:[ribosomal protein S18]-alanine N-acetyltransferase
MVELKPMQGMRYTLRPMQHADIPRVADIDRQAFPGEWSFRSHSSYRQDLSNPSIRYVVACAEKARSESEAEPVPKRPWLNRFLSQWRAGQDSDSVVGFSGFWMMMREAHIIAIGVRDDHRRLGIGEALLIATIDLAATLNANVVTLEVRASNTMAQALYAKYGFQVMGRRVKYYSSNGEDAIVMSTDDITGMPYQAFFQRLKKAHAERHRDILARVP